MTNIYDQHSSAFSNVSAFVVLDNDAAFGQSGARVATIAFKFPKDGAGRLYCYLHILGLEMVRGMAGGYGYDKKSAAFDYATRELKPYNLDKSLTHQDYIDHKNRLNALRERFQVLAKNMGGKDWQGALRDAGFTVLQAV